MPRRPDDQTGPQPRPDYVVPEPVGPMPDGERRAFVRWLAPAAVAMQQQLGIPASAAVAQAAYETGFGTSRYARDGLNLFGMRGTGSGWGNPFWAGDVLHSQADGSRWRSYRTPGASLMDYGHLFYRVSAYAPALAHRGDAERFLAEIVPSYAPRGDGNPTYLEDVLAIRESYGLASLDVPPDGWSLSAPLVPARHIETWLAATGPEPAPELPGGLA